MPHSTYLRHTLHNLGPLTTTFTAPAECTNLASESDAHYIYGNFGYKSPHPRGGVACTSRTVGDECQPNGSKRDEIEGRGAELFLYGIAYYSPGIQCPANWTTVQGTPTRMASFLTASETMNICCPSNYEIDTYFYSWCISSLTRHVTSFGYSDFCFPGDLKPTKTFSSFDGSKLTGGVVVGYQTGTITEYQHDTVILSSGTLYGDDVVFATVPAITLINKEGDESQGCYTASRPTLFKLVGACLFAAAFLGGL